MEGMIIAVMKQLKQLQYELEKESGFQLSCEAIHVGSWSMFCFMRRERSEAYETLTSRIRGGTCLWLGKLVLKLSTKHYLLLLPKLLNRLHPEKKDRWYLNFRLGHVTIWSVQVGQMTLYKFSPASHSDIVTVPREYQQLYFPQVEITLTHNYSSSRLSVNSL